MASLGIGILSRGGLDITAAGKVGVRRMNLTAPFEDFLVQCFQMFGRRRDELTRSPPKALITCSACREKAISQSSTRCTMLRSMSPSAGRRVELS